VSSKVLLRVSEMIDRSNVEKEISILPAERPVSPSLQPPREAFNRSCSCPSSEAESTSESEPTTKPRLSNPIVSPPSCRIPIRGTAHPPACHARNDALWSGRRSRIPIAISRIPQVVTPPTAVDVIRCYTDNPVCVLPLLRVIDVRPPPIEKAASISEETLAIRIADSVTVEVFDSATERASRTFHCAHVFDAAASNIEVNKFLRPLYEKAARGGHVTIGADGYTHTGKSFTFYEDSESIAPFTARFFFQTMNAKTVWFAASQVKHQDVQPKTYIETIEFPRQKLASINSTSKLINKAAAYSATTAEQLLTLLEWTREGRAVAKTPYNHTSSRSHLICTIFIPMGGQSNGVDGRLTLVDFAGAEPKDAEDLISTELSKERSSFFTQLQAYPGIATFRDGVLAAALKSCFPKSPPTGYPVFVYFAHVNRSQSVGKCSLRTLEQAEMLKGKRKITLATRSGGPESQRSVSAAGVNARHPVVPGLALMYDSLRDQAVPGLHPREPRPTTSHGTRSEPRERQPARSGSTGSESHGRQPARSGSTGSEPRERQPARSGSTGSESHGRQPARSGSTGSESYGRQPARSDMI